MPERPVVPDDSGIEHPPAPEVTREPFDEVHETDAAADQESHDPYQPL